MLCSSSVTDTSPLFFAKNSVLLLKLVGNLGLIFLMILMWSATSLHFIHSTYALLVLHDVWENMLSIFSILDCLTVKLFLDQNNKRIVLAIQSGLKSELTWALNTLTLLSFKEKEDMRKDATPLAKIPGLLDALLQVVCVFIHLFCFKFCHYGIITHCIQD